MEIEQATSGSEKQKGVIPKPQLAISFRITMKILSFTTEI